MFSRELVITCLVMKKRSNISLNGDVKQKFKVDVKRNQDWEPLKQLLEFDTLFDFLI